MTRFYAFLRRYAPLFPQGSDRVPRVARTRRSAAAAIDDEAETDPDDQDEDYFDG